MPRIYLSALIALLSIPVFAQNPVTADSPFQVRFAANLNLNDSFIDITNTGANGGNICVNVYAFYPDAEEGACCTCTVTPDELVSYSVKNDIGSNLLVPLQPNSLVIKLVATTGAPSCNASVTAPTLTTGLAAWMTTTHAITKITRNEEGSATTTTTATLEETPFTPSTLSAVELSNLTNKCADIQANGSGAGICKGCTLGGR